MGSRKPPTAALAATKPKSSRKKIPTAKVKAQQAAKKAAVKAKAKATITEILGEGDDNEEEESDEEDSKLGKGVQVNWTDDKLSERLITAISENKSIKRALFLPVGPNTSTSKGGGKTKVAVQWQLCVILFGEDPKYKDAIAAATAPKDQLVWANKVKNRLHGMAKMTRGYINLMGETGAGLTSAADIDMSVTNKEISEACPWFFEMRELIGQRPNLVPVGLGNSETGFDMDVLSTAPTANDHASDAGNNWEYTLGTPDESSTQQDGDLLVSGDDDMHSTKDFNEDSHQQGTDDSKPATAKKGKPAVKTTKRASAPGTSTLPSSTSAVAAAPPKASKKSKLAELADVAREEEVTRQKEIDLATIRAKQSLKELELKVKLTEMKEKGRQEDKSARRAQRESKLRLKVMKLKMAHELRMRTLTAGSSHTHAASGFFDFAASSSDASDSFPDMDLDMGSIDVSDAGSSHGGVSFGNIFPSFNGF
ncbi:hypothetical protein C8R45DRAFT_1216876 [Mycena sanguinolenta]|nr:hypothetical protein C8R45DRAFT_1216876 [Mycena sanguinolenta]